MSYAVIEALKDELKRLAKFERHHPLPSGQAPVGRAGKKN